MTSRTSVPPSTAPSTLATPFARRRELERERFTLRLARRSVTVPIYLLSFVINTVGAPLFLTLALAGDLARRRGTTLVRCMLGLWAYLAVEAFGLLLFLPMWIASQGSEERRLGMHYWFARIWSRAVFWSLVRLFEVRVVVEGDEEAAKGPVLVFCRHVSPVDNLLAGVFLEGRHHLRLRWVMNSWLVRDPCIDIVGHRLPSTFLTVGSREAPRQIAKVAALGDDLGPRDGVLMFPEGALFTPQRLKRAVARIRRSGDEKAARRAEAFRHVLPPQLGGSLALLERAPTADIVFCAHTGLEDGSYRALLQGGLLRRELDIAFWRVPRAEVPNDAEGRAVWLRAQWARVDDWIEERRNRLGSEAAPEH